MSSTKSTTASEEVPTSTTEEGDVIGQENDLSVPEGFGPEDVQALLDNLQEGDTSHPTPMEEAVAEYEAENETSEEEEVLGLEEAVARIAELEAELVALKTPKSKKELTSDEKAITESHMTPAEFAQELKANDRAVRKAIRAGNIHAVKVGGRWYISDEELERVRAVIEAGKKAEAETEAEAEAEAEEVSAEEAADQAAMAAHEELVEAIKELDLTS